MANPKQPAPKKAHSAAAHSFAAPIESHIDGLQRVARSKNQTGAAAEGYAGDLSEIQAPEPALVSRLINFIKKI